MGLSWFFSALTTFLLMKASSSPKYARRSLWPRMTCVANSERSIGAEISPVNAPFASGCMFCAPSFTVEPSRALPTASSEVNGGHTTISTSLILPVAATISFTSETASPFVLFIFQFPAMSFLRGFMIEVASSG